MPIGATSPVLEASGTLMMMTEFQNQLDRRRFVRTLLCSKDEFNKPLKLNPNEYNQLAAFY
jgi:hypothetical protein